MAYRGVTARMPVGLQGFTGTKNPSQAGPGHLVYAEGVDFDGGVMKKDGGAEKLNAFGLPFTMLSGLAFLLPFTGADASTTITDISLNPKVWTAAGNAQLDTAIFKFAPSALLLDGTGDFITTPDHADFTIGTNPFTIAGFFNNTRAALGADVYIAGQGDAGVTAAATAWGLRRSPGSFIQFFVSNGSAFTTITGTTAFTDVLNTGWHHVAVTWDLATLRLFIDGVLEASTAFTGPVNNSNQVMGQGCFGNGFGNTWQGSLDDFWMHVGLAFWTANFAVPTSAMTTFLQTIDTVGTDPTAVVAGIQFSPVQGTYTDYVMVEGGHIIRNINAGGSFFSIGTLNGVNNFPPKFVPAGGEDVGQARKLFLFSSHNQVQVMIGDAFTFAAISTPPADWSGGGNFPTFGVIHQGRLFGGGNASDPHRLYYSSTTNHQVFTGAGTGTFPIYPGEGDRLVGALSFRGAIILWKYPQGIYVINTQDPDPAGWIVQKLTGAVGSLNAHCQLQIENDVLYAERLGQAHLLTATNEFGDVNTSNLSEIATMAPFMRDELSLENMEKSFGLWYPKKRQAWFFFPEVGDTHPSIRIMTVFQGQQQAATTGQALPPRFTMSRRDDNLRCGWMRINSVPPRLPEPCVGTGLGFIYLLDRENIRSKDGLGYDFAFSTPSTDFSWFDQGLATRNKNGAFLEIVHETRGDWDLMVDIFWDEQYSQTIAFNMGGIGGTLGSFTLDTDFLGTVASKSHRERMEGSGRRWRMAALNNGIDQDISLAEFHVSFTPGDERTD